MQISLKEKPVSLKGVYTIRVADIVTDEARALEKEIAWKRDLGQDFRVLLDALHSMCSVKTYVLENIVPTVGRTMIANNLTNVSPTNVMKITHSALGSGSTAPANSDTQLATETYRNAIASISNATNTGYATGFYTTTETSGTYAEVGLFCNGTGSANSGVLLSRVLASITKTTSQTLTIDWTLTIS
jgi:hypothetical protein